MEFNVRSRKTNAFLSSISGVVSQLVNTVLSFGFRTAFIYILSKEYLGINGLFTNILQVFSLAELGIGTAIIFKLYEPIKDKDIEDVAKYMNFYRDAYRIISIVILAIGLGFIPFLTNFIKEINEVPKDINIYTIYILFLIQSVTSYLFTYKEALLSADQKNYIVTFSQLIRSLIYYGISFLVLVFTKNYTLTLLSGISSNLIYNFMYSMWISKKYKKVFEIRTSLSKEKKKSIIKDTYSLLLHKIGSIVVSSTDNLILSSYIGLGTLGIYSNYSLIVLTIQVLVSRLVGSFDTTIGNLNVSVDKQYKFEIYSKLSFVVYWLASFTTVSLFTLINPFIELWIGVDMKLDIMTVTIIILSYYIQICRIATGSFINASGLFTKDRYRPLIESGLNLFLSIVLVQKIGIKGIFIGTIVSNLATVWWREPYLLFKHIFQRDTIRYYLNYFQWLIYTFIISAILYFLFNSLEVNLFNFLLRLIATLVITNSLLFVVFKENSSLKYYVEISKNLYNRKKTK